MAKSKLLVNYVVVRHEWGNGEATQVSVSSEDAYPDALRQCTGEAMHAFSEAYCFVRQAEPDDAHTDGEAAD
jgi:hypothetical protein